MVILSGICDILIDTHHKLVKKAFFRHQAIVYYGGDTPALARYLDHPHHHICGFDSEKCNNQMTRQLLIALAEIVEKEAEKAAKVKTWKDRLK